MGEARREALRVGFDRSIKLEFNGAKVSSDSGLVTYRDLDEALQLIGRSGTGHLANVGFLVSVGSPGYDSDLRSDKWETLG